MDNTTWVQRHSLNSDATTLGDIDGDGGRRADLVVNFAGAGTWILFNNSTWSQLSADVTPTKMTTADLDGNGQADLLLNLTGLGVWVWMNNTEGIQLHPADAEDMVAGPFDNN